MMSDARVRWSQKIRKAARNMLALSLVAGCGVPAYSDEVVPSSPQGVETYVDPSATPAQTPMVMMPLDTAGRYFTLRHFAGEGIANEESFTAFGLFQPLTDRASYFQGNALWFTESRFIVQNDGRVGGNLGLGYRHYQSELDRIWGLNFWKDLDGTHERFFHQFGFGFESLGEIVDFRANGYVPVGNIERNYGYTATLPNARFLGRNIYFDRDRLVENAMLGVDTEMGVRLPGQFARNHDIRGYAGWYHFDSSDGPEINGVSARIEGNLRQDVVAQISVTDDDVFHTNVTFGLTWVFSGRLGTTERIPMNVRERIGQPVQRNHNVVVTKRRVYDGVIATDPTTGLPIVVVHASSANGSVGNGSVENPFSNLALAGDPNQSAPGDILFAHADSVFDGQNILLQDDQRFLGEGLDYMVDTAEFGAILLPRATDGTNLPVIQNSPANVASVSLVSNNEVAGFAVLNGQGPAFLADGAGGEISIHDNSVNGSLRGIEIRNSTGTFNIESTPIANTTQEGIVLADNTSGTINFNGITTVANPQGVGISISGGAADITFQEVALTNRNTTAIGIGGTTGGTITFEQSITNQPLTLQSAVGSLDEAIGIANSASTISFPHVVIDDSNRVALGMPSVVFGSSTGDLSFEQLDITNSNGRGLYAINIATLNIAGGTISTAGGEAAYINGATDIDTVFNSLSATATTNGIAVINSGGRFLVTGDGSTPGSGGTLQTTGAGVRLNVAQNVRLNFMNIASEGDGLLAFNTDDILVNQSTFTSNTPDWTAINIQNSSEGNSGTPLALTNNIITGGAANQVGILVINNESPQGALRIDNQLITLGAGGTGINIQALDSAPGSGPGDIVLLSLHNNIVTAPTPFTSTETLATIFGQILVNGVLQP